MLVAMVAVSVTNSSGSEWRSRHDINKFHNLGCINKAETLLKVRRIRSVLFNPLNLKLYGSSIELLGHTRCRAIDLCHWRLWYSPAVFGKAWMRENGFTEESMKGGNMVKIFGLAFLLGLIAAVNLAMFMGPENKPAHGRIVGFSCRVRLGGTLRWYTLFALKENPSRCS